MAEARIDVVIGSQQAQSGARTVQRAIDDVKQSFLELSAKVFVAEQALVRVWGLAGRGAAFEETMSRLNRQMGAFHGTAAQMVADLEAISNQTLAIDRAAMIASRGLATGLNPDQIKLFTQAADVLDDVLGIDLPNAFDQIVQAATTGRTAVLSNIGVYVDLEDEVRKLAVSTNRTTEQITKQEKVMLTAKAVTAQAGEALRKLSDGALSDSDRLKQVEKRWADLWTAIGQGAKNTVLSILDFFDDVGKRMEAFAKEQAERQKQPGQVITPFGRGGFEPSEHDPRIFGPTFHDFVAGQSREAAQREHDDIVRRTQEANFGVGSERFQPILGRAIAQQGGANFGPPRQPPTALPTDIQGKQLEAERDRRQKILEQDFELTRQGLEAMGQLHELGAQRQQITEEDLVAAKASLRQQELTSQRQLLEQLLTLENQTHKRRVEISFETVQEKLEEENRHKDRVVELNGQIRANEVNLANARMIGDAQIEGARLKAEAERGARTQVHLNADFRMREEARQRDLEASELYYRGQIDMALAEFANDEEIARKERVLLREQLAFKLRLSQEEVNRLLFLRKAGDLAGVSQILDRADPTLDRRAREGIIDSFSAKDLELQERATGDFFAGWQRGLQRYTRDTESAFGMAQDMARRTAQTMEQGFQRFFFDGMDGKFTRFKDVLTGVLDFTKQIVSQMVAQMMTVGLIKPTAAAVGGFFGGGGGTAPGPLSINGVPLETLRFGGIMPVERYAAGGTTSRPQVAIFGEGAQSEAFVPLPDGRSIPVTMRFDRATPSQTVVAAPQVSVPVDIQVINQMPGAQVEASQASGPDGRQQIRLLIRQEMSTALREGAMDKDLQRFGLAPQPVRR